MFKKGDLKLSTAHKNMQGEGKGKRASKEKEHPVECEIFLLSPNQDFLKFKVRDTQIELDL